MDPLTILSTVLSTSIAIHRWISDLKSKQEAFLDLKTSLSSITLVLHPLREKAASGALDSQAGILACIQDLGECLDRARDHLQTWQDTETRKAGALARRILAFLDPSQILDEIKEDHIRLNQKIGVLTFAIQLAWIPGVPAKPPTTSPLDFISNPEAKAFWSQMIGETSSSCSADDFRTALSAWRGVNATIPDTLMLQLDEQGFGQITPSSFSRFVGTQSLAQAISRYTQPTPHLPATDRLIIWVAGESEKYSSSIGYAESLGIKVVVLPSLAAVKFWMELNDKFVRTTANAHYLRFLSDSVHTDGGIANPAAGELLLRYIRGRQIHSPCLIFGDSVATTAYVTGYARAGSTTDLQIVRGYIKALADGMRDVEWVGFDRRWGQVPPAQAAQTPVQHGYFIRPLLLYLVGTKPEQDQAHIDYAAAQGITVVSLFSTDELRRYIVANQDQLRRMAAAHRLRFITQNVRYEGGALVLSAGEDTARCVRGLGFAAPVLVLCTSSVASTRFVTIYGRAGSTTDARVVHGYIRALAMGFRDTEWVGFDRKGELV
ncbi:hypothetical protein FB451DRAFT_1287843 [Mycena latifolia]|nr:hypothetical protein FB451DRAFT_1287843 [Mycena latifolia]